MTASLSFWLNASTGTFANGPFDPTPYQAPVTVIQNSQLIVDVYYVTLTGNAAAPWNYTDPSTFTSAGISFGSRFSYSLYASAVSFTRLVDQYGPKARFNISLVSAQLNSDLLSLASVVAVFQAVWSTISSSPAAQLAASILKVVGYSLNNTQVQVLPSVTTLTGATATALAYFPTANGAVALQTIVELVGVTVAGVVSQYQLQAYNGAQSLPGIVLPNDFNSSTNPVAWIQIL